MLDMESTFIRLPEQKDAPKEEKRTSFVKVYKRKKYFNRKCNFEDEDTIQISFGPNKPQSKHCYLPELADKGIQHKPGIGEDPANTELLEFASEGISHYEGGWPKDINYANSEQTARYKRKIEKTEEYITQLTNLTQTMLHMIKQNNAVNIYQNYFEEIEPLELTENYSSRTITVFHNHGEQVMRPVTNLAWDLEKGTQFASSFSGDYQFNHIESAYIWDVEAPNTPLIALKSAHPAPCIAYNPKDYHMLASGINSGQVVIWDTRISGDEQLVSNHENSHRDKINSLVWFTSKTNSEFFSGSNEGQILWWDIRKFDKPTDRIFLDPIKGNAGELERAYAISALDSDPSIATKYMAGTEHGVLFTCNRKGKSAAEKITSKVKCHYGAICSVTRSPHFIKNYMTVGDWQAKIWTEDNKDTSIVWTKEYFAQLTCGVWSETRCAVFFIGRIDGIVDVWDIVQDLNKPVYSIKISDYPVLSVKHHKEGRFLIVGTSNGHVHLQELSNNLVLTYSNERPLMASSLERETKRERFLEIRLREIKLRDKELRREIELERQQYDEDKAAERDNVKVAENAFMNTIKAEITRREGDNIRMLEREHTLYSRTGPARAMS